ncbi:MAG: hypothetical protein GY749_16575 [Desulfobacteraceae bacterium]|nr:hypothetical protein [Desulfobacteraceae bacterium]
MKTLRWLLTRSFLGRVTGVRRVTENKGRN